MSVTLCLLYVTAELDRVTPQSIFYKVKFVEQILFNLRTITVLSKCGTLYVKMYV